MHTVINLEILNSFNPELQLKNTESAIKNKLKNLLNELKSLELPWFCNYNKQRTKMKQNIVPFI